MGSALYFAGGFYATRNNDQLRYLLSNSTEAPKSIAKQTVRHAVKRCFAPTITQGLTLLERLGENANFRKPIRIEEDVIRCRAKRNSRVTFIHVTSMVSASIGKAISAATVRPGTSSLCSSIRQSREGHD
ncbi:hypothetical protein TNCV_4634421 [Trichonephila clavipes]|nr:hypothetical protein TNCV_4634421 [Trichonephila clavipes]